MPHVYIGRVVLGADGGVGVRGATAAVTATGFDQPPATAKAVTGDDGAFAVVLSYGNVATLNAEVLSPAGVPLARFELPSPGDSQDTVSDIGTVVMPPEMGGIEIVRREPPAPPRPRVTGRVVDSRGECSIHCLQVLIEARVGQATEFRPIAVARTDPSGRFFVDYPRVRITEARAVIPGVDAPVPLPVGDDGLLGPDPLLVIDVQAAEHSHESAGCDCETTEVPRLPGQQELAGSPSTYSADLGAGCVTFTAPNRALEEFDFWTVVRTSQPSVRRTSAADPGGSPTERRGEGVPTPGSTGTPSRSSTSR
jgi:hypothetical protein